METTKEAMKTNATVPTLFRWRRGLTKMAQKNKIRGGG